MNKYKFPDYNLSGFFNGLYAIEPEISDNFRKEALLGYSYHSESYKIKELNRLHEESEEGRTKAINLITEFYKDKFPIWGDNRLSWGVHFHIFKWDYRKIKNSGLSYKILNCPLHCKIKWNKIYNRYLCNRSMFPTTDSFLYSNSKGYAFCYKNRYTSNTTGTSIEFRCNNVFDSRMYWYYVWLIICVKNNIKFKKTSDQLREYAKNWSRIEYDSDLNDLELYKINWYRVSEEDMKVIKYNSILILKALEIHWLFNAALALKEYLNECWLDIKYEVCYRDSYSWEAIEDFFTINKIKLFNTTYENIRFKSENNFYWFIIDRLKEKAKSAGIAMKLLDTENIPKHYSKYIPVEPNTEQQDTLFDN